MASPSLETFHRLCQATPSREDYSLAEAISEKVPLYLGSTLRDEVLGTDTETDLLTEWTHCLRSGPGVFVIKNAYPARSVIDAITQAFYEIIEQEKATGKNKGDHFGNNERIWNALQKTAEKVPEQFIDYYGNPLLALACRAWLGPAYQLTAQVNIVKPGSEAQAPHRDFHLGFQSNEVTAQFPLHAQTMSQYLTLQGAIAHSTMPLESGPTQLLPFSQTFDLGYLAFRLPAFQAYFRQYAKQVPLNLGDLLFFNPALFHAAGSNRSQSDRIANLVQISSAFGKPMESINRFDMIEAVYPSLCQRHQTGQLSGRLLTDAIAALADGYAFPTNLDSDPPIDGNAPRSEQSLVEEAVTKQWSWTQLETALVAYRQRRRA